MKTCNTSYEHLLPAILGPLLGGGVLVLTPVPTYPDTIVYEAASGDRHMVFKAAEPDGRDPDGIALEAWACERAAAAGVPAPAVVELDGSAARFPSSFFVMQKVDGVPLSEMHLSQWQTETVLERLSPQIARLHAIRVPGFGRLEERGGEVRGGAASWRDALLGGVHQSIDELERTGALTAAEAAHARSAVASGESVAQWDDPRLLHGDLGFLHVWVDPKTMRVTSLVDFGECSAGDPAYDFTDFDRRFLPVLLSRYGASDDFARRVRYYELVRTIPWARKWLERGYDGVVDSLRQVLLRYVT
jgi:aminoglycoside phosphotransferase (APT) family kinase protein